MADGHHLEKPKTGHISATVWPIGVKIGSLTLIDPRNRTAVESMNLQKFKMANGRHIENR